MNKRTILFAAVLIIATVVVKFFCAPSYNLSGLTTIYSIALFSGMSISSKNNSFLLPLIALFVSDIVIEALYQMNLFAFPGFYKIQMWNYVTLLITVLIGWFIKGKSYTSLGLSAFIASTLFFLVSNFQVWIISSDYANSFIGLMECYTAGIPFYLKSLISTMVFLPAIIYFYNYTFNQKTKALFV